jgi:predicted RNase H-like nuclease
VTEVWPKLSIVLLSQHLKLSKRVLQDYRSLESGTEARVEILEHLAAEKNIFIYDRDLKKLAHSLAAFDSFVCAYTGLLHYQGQTKKAPYGFPLETGWVLVPEWEEIN